MSEELYITRILSPMQTLQFSSLLVLDDLQAS